MDSSQEHFAVPFTEALLDFLHRYLISTWYYKAEIIEVPGLLTAVLVTYDDQEKDVIVVNDQLSYEEFLERMSKVKADWKYFYREHYEKLCDEPHRLIGGWEGRTIYCSRGGAYPEYWQPDQAVDFASKLIYGTANLQGPILEEQAKNLDQIIPKGKTNWRDYEDFVRIVINFLFREHLGEAKAQVRNEPGNEGLEIRDLVAHNRAESGVFLDLKAKYQNAEILFEVKNKDEITRDDLRQLYCYLKPAIGLWGFIVCRGQPKEPILAYNRTLFQNFAHARGVAIITDHDLRKMIDMKKRERDPAEHIQELYSNFIRSI